MRGMKVTSRFLGPIGLDGLDARGVEAGGEPGRGPCLLAPRVPLPACEMWSRRRAAALLMRAGRFMAGPGMNISAPQVRR